MLAEREPVTAAKLDKALLDLDTVAQAVLESRGNLALAAENLLGHHSKVSELLACITADERALTTFALKARAYGLIQSISMFSELQTSLMAQVGDLKPSEAARMYSDVGKLLNELTTIKPGAPVNNNQTNNTVMLLGGLNPDMKQVMRHLLNEPATQGAQTAIPLDPQPVSVND